MRRRLGLARVILARVIVVQPNGYQVIWCSG
jgi:hypothetical protein